MQCPQRHSHIHSHFIIIVIHDNRLTRLITSKPLGAIESLITITHSVNEAKRILEQFDLDLALKYLALPLLNKRIQGINDIKDYIEWTQKKEEYHAKVCGSTRPPTHTSL
jgi:hypothetical protein